MTTLSGKNPVSSSSSRGTPKIHYAGNWAVVTGASSGLGRGIALGLAQRGMALVLTGRNEARLAETADLIRTAVPGSELELVVADLATQAGVSALLGHAGDRPVEVLVNNAGFGTYGSFAEASSEREDDEIAVDVAAVVRLSRAFLSGMIARGHGGILNVASTIAFQPAPQQAVYGASKAFVLSFSEALWAEARPAGVSVTALCPGPTRTGFVDALEADVGHAAIYSKLAEPGPVIDAGLRALDRGRAVVVPGLQNWLLSVGGRLMPRKWLTLMTARLLGAGKRAPKPSLVVDNHAVIAAPAGTVWGLLTGVANWPEWYRDCRWVEAEGETAFRWKAHPVELESRVVASEAPHRFAFTADGTGVHAEREFTVEPTADGSGTVITSHETQVGWLPRFGGAIVGPKLKAANDRFFADLAAAAGAPLAA